MKVHLQPQIHALYYCSLEFVLQKVFSGHFLHLTPTEKSIVRNRKSALWLECHQSIVSFLFLLLFFFFLNQDPSPEGARQVMSADESHKTRGMLVDFRSVWNRSCAVFVTLINKEFYDSPEEVSEGWNIFMETFFPLFPCWVSTSRLLVCNPGSE